MSVARDQKVWLGGYDFTGAMNALGLELGLETQDATTFGSPTRHQVAGQKTIRAEHQGYFDAAQVDQPLFDALGLDGEVMTTALGDGQEGSSAYSFPASVAQYTPAGAVGEQLGFSVSVEAAGENATLVRGTIVHHATRTTTGRGAIRNLGPAAAGQSLYAALHVVRVSGTRPTLAVVVESGATAVLNSPTERIAFARVAALGSQWRVAAGPIADPYYRVRWTIGGSSTSVAFLVVVGIA